MLRCLPILLVASAAHADPRPGANHHLGDDSFVAAFGRAPTGGDTERLRMKVHLQHVRAALGKLPPTKPELAAKRAELLGYLDDYIAKGTTPINMALPWRSPVFIDDLGNICAVGYLIERSVGRAVAESIAKAHRFELLEDIAAAMPEVRAWIAASGLTLDELASIQPGYAEPAVESWRAFDVVAWKVPNGAYQRDGAVGRLRRGRMEGVWKVTKKEKLAGKGTFTHGAGTWTSYYETGKRMARGPMLRNVAQGEWTLFHPSGNVAARGTFDRGIRDGAWQFFYDTPHGTPIARGSFKHGSVMGTWRHYDRKGRLLSTSVPTRSNDPYADATLMTFEPDRRGVQHEAHRVGGVSSHVLHGFYKGGERIYTHYDFTWDAEGKLLEKASDGTWIAADCGWTEKQKRVARATDITSLHLMQRSQEPKCTDPRAIPAARAKVLDELLAAKTAVRMPTPAFVKQMIRALHADPMGEEAAPDQPEDPPQDDHLADLSTILVDSMSWYVEWPHIDGRFMRLHATMAGYRYFANGQEPSEPESE